MTWLRLLLMPCGLASLRFQPPGTLSTHRRHQRRGHSSASCSRGGDQRHANRRADANAVAHTSAA
jgi:hypothetical protein